MIESHAMASRSVRRIVALMGLVMFVAGFQFSLTIAVATPLVKRCLQFAYDDQYAISNYGKYTSALLAVSNLCNAFANPFWGRTVDKHGRRPVLLIALCVAAISMSIFAASNIFWVALASRFLIGLSDPSIFVSKVVIGDVSVGTNDGRRFSLIYTFFALSQTVSPFVASVFESIGSYPSLGPCLLASGTAVAVFLVLLAWLPETRAPVCQSNFQQMPWKAIATNQSISVPICLYTLLAMVLTSAETATSYIIIEKRGGLALPPEAIGRLFSIQGAFYVITQLFICPKIISKFGTTNTFRLCTLSLLGIYPCCVLPAMSSVPFLFMAVQMSIKVIATSTAITSGTVLINSCTSADNRGAITSLAQSGAGISRSVGLLLIGSLYDYSAARSIIIVPYAALGIAAALVSALSLLIVAPNHLLLHNHGSKATESPDLAADVAVQT